MSIYLLTNGAFLQFISITHNTCIITLTSYIPILNIVFILETPVAMNSAVVQSIDGYLPISLCTLGFPVNNSVLIINKDQLKLDAALTGRYVHGRGQACPAAADHPFVCQDGVAPLP